MCGRDWEEKRSKNKKVRVRRGKRFGTWIVNDSEGRIQCREWS